MSLPRSTWRRVLLAGAAALGLYLIVGIILAGRGELPNPPSSEPIVLHGGRARGNNHTIASRSWSLSYDRGEFSSDDTTGTLQGVHDGIVYRKGKPYLEISARRVSLNTQTLDFTAVGLVHIEMLNDTSHRSFDTDFVSWTNDAKLLRMDHPSYMHVGGQTLKIRSIAIDFDKNEVHFGKIDGSVGFP